MKDIKALQRLAKIEAVYWQSWVSDYWQPMQKYLAWRKVRDLLDSKCDHHYEADIASNVIDHGLTVLEDGDSWCIVCGASERFDRIAASVVLERIMEEYAEY